MSEISGILKLLEGTREGEILAQMDEVYRNVFQQQNIWYEKSQFFCMEGCGECCRGFEPDLTEGEVIFMAAWIIENNPELAEKVSEGNFPFSENKGCMFWDENNPYHCAIYGGRGCICRFFGACGSKAKNGDTVFKPCRFYSAEKLAQHKPPLEHRQYSQDEILKMFEVLPPVMSDLMEGIENITPHNKETSYMRDILPETIRRLKWIVSMNNN